MANVDKGNLCVMAKLSQLESCISEDVYLRLHLEATQALNSPLVREAHFVCPSCSEGFIVCFWRMGRKTLIPDFACPKVF